MHNESPLPIGRVEQGSADALGRVEPCSTDEKQPSMARLYNSEEQPTSGRLYQSGSVEQQRQRAKRTAAWVGAIAVLVYVGFILSGVIGR
ncbi:hypothetical protein [Stenotrophomonas forensis]|uniref:Transmembrane protein n=2 Tax=Stenotrophomonas TaxID=40323 RepID=A0ABY7Y218_9GAMM|nr:membrane protein [Stenotrophomonas maltophilia]WDM64024.1 hypothetical protein K5L94_01650 [Stenotrophomonas sp. DFS-20110405]KOQ74657.1 membrane protein [Stenotrophomonas maltophilia]MBH1479833.1 hypothetical protein [Stenotrophomonas maltophilia]MBH1504922.1 hypothetical protein [Stenotrophomonas maltophilia]